MSADDGIYLHKFKNGWRVTHAQAIENISWRPGKDGYNHKALNETFADSPLFKTEAEAQKYAFKLYDKAVKEFGYCPEYGISKV